MTPHPSRSDAGFSLPEVMVSMGIMLVVLAGTFSAMTNAMQAEQTARGITTLNGHLRASMDVLVRDLLQVGQGLQVGRVVGIPNGVGATPITRPGPAAAGACAGVTPFPLSPTLSAVTVGPDLGPPINRQCTDVITTLALDGAFERVTVDAIAADAESITINAATNISDDPDVNGDNVRVGDLLEIRRGAVAVIVAVTDVAAQVVTFAPGDPLGLNQFGAALNNSMTQVQAAPLAGGTQANRVRMITYYVDTLTNPASPRLMRQINGQPRTPSPSSSRPSASPTIWPTASTNPVGVRMDAADLGVAGRMCAIGLLAEPDPEGQRDAGDPLGEEERQRRVLPQHALHAGGATQPGVRGSLQLGAMTCFREGRCMRNEAMTRDRESGVALLSAILVLMLMSALLVGFIAMVNADQSASGINRDQTQAYAAAHAGVEKLTADLGQLFQGNFAPTNAQVNALWQDADDAPALPGISFLTPNGNPGYRITYTDLLPARRQPGHRELAQRVEHHVGAVRRAGRAHHALHDRSHRPHRRQRRGAHAPRDADGRHPGVPVRHLLGERPELLRRPQLRLRRPRALEPAPLAEAGWCDNTTSDAARPRHRGGRDHQGSARQRCRFPSRGRPDRARGGLHADAAGAAGAGPLPQPDRGRRQRVRLRISCRANRDWTNTSTGDYNTWIRNSRTGARNLSLPLVSDGATPIDIIRRPPLARAPVEDPASSLGQQRFYNMATLRILLSDKAADLTGLPDAIGTPIRLANPSWPAFPAPSVPQFTITAAEDDMAGSLPTGNYNFAASTGVVNNGFRTIAGTP